MYACFVCGCACTCARLLLSGGGWIRLCCVFEYVGGLMSVIINCKVDNLWKPTEQTDTVKPVLNGPLGEWSTDRLIQVDRLMQVQLV